MTSVHVGWLYNATYYDSVDSDPAYCLIGGVLIYTQILEKEGTIVT